jgi:hypothetical protein
VRLPLRGAPQGSETHPFAAAGASR